MGELARVARAAIPGLLALADKAPIVGPVAGLLARFYEAYERVQTNGQQYKELRRRVDYCTKYVTQCALYLDRLIGPAQSEEKIDEIVTGAKELVQLPYDALAECILECGELLKRLKYRQEKASIGGSLANYVLSAEDEKELQSCSEDLSRTLAELANAISSSAAMRREIVERVDVMQRLAAVLKPQYYEDIEVEFHPDTREWLHDSVSSWLTREQNSTAETVSKTGVQSSSRYYWLQGEAGVGKTAFTASLTSRMEINSSVLGSVFFKFGDMNRSHEDSCEDPVLSNRVETPAATTETVYSSCARNAVRRRW